MATLERLVKALEILKVFQPEVSQAESAKKKEVVITGRDKAINCGIIADCICAQNLRNVADFPKFLGIAMETFLLMCDDKESDVRMAADECLNRTIKTLLETNLGRLQVELYKEIKKNGASRSLRSALSRFADMCHLIRPQKCRPYVVNLLPCISRICKRDEEAIQETVATAMQKLCPVLMGFTNDNEVKVLLKAFLPNIKSSSATCRRTAAASLTLICQECRKPPTFFAWLLNILLENVIPVSDATPSHTLLGVLLTLRHIMPHLSTSAEEEDSLRDSFGVKTKSEQVTISTQQLVQIYELLLFYTEHQDHNVVTASLETLQQLLKTAPQALLKVLTAKGSISFTSIYDQDRLQGRGRTGSHSERLPSTADDTGLDEEIDFNVGADTSVSAEDSSSVLTDLDQSELEYPQFDSGNVSSGQDSEKKDGDVDEPDVFVTTEDEYTNIEIGDMTEKSERSEKSYPATLSQSSSADTLSDMKNISPSHHPDSLKIGVSEDINDSSSNRSIDMDISESAPVSQSSTQGSVLREGDVGQITDAEAPLIHGVRLLCSRFLLTGYPMGLIPDRQVRVSLKALALGCVSSAVSLYPQAFVIKMHKSSPVEGDIQEIRDVLLYSNHNDPQLKGNTALLIGNFIHAVLKVSSGNFSNWMQENQEHSKVELDELVERLSILMEDESSVALRLSLIALKSCIVDILASYHSYIGIKLLLVLLRVRNNNYWLVKVELCELLSLVDFKLVSFLEEQCEDLRKGQHHYSGKLELQKHMIEDVILYLLSDEDARVRHAAATALIAMVPKFFFPVDTSQHDPVIAKAEESATKFLDPILHEWSQTPQPLVHSLVKPFHQTERFQHSSVIDSTLSRVVHVLSSALNKSTSRYFTYGICHALCQLCEAYPVTQYPGAWGCAGGKDSVLSHRRTSSTSRPTGPASPGLQKNFNVLTIEDLVVGNSSGCLPTILSILTSTPIVLDISAHQDVLTLACNLFAGASLKCLRNPHDGTKTSDDGRWVSLSDRSLVPLADALLVHIAKMLNVCAHVIDDQSLGPPQTKSTLPSLPNAPSISPIKRKAKGIKDEVSEKINSPSDEKKKDKGKSADKGDKDKDSDKQKNTSKDGLGSVHNLPHYTKLYETLKGAYSNYMISLELGSVEKFGSLLQTVLRSFSQVLEIATLKEIGPHAEEFLGYLKSSVTMEPTTAILCVQQLLKALFGTNMASQWESSTSGNTSRKPGKATRLTACTRPGLYHSCFTTPYTQLTQCLASATFKATTHAAAVSTPDSDETTSILGWLRKRTERKIPAVLKSGTKADKTSIASYIRLFEPLVIKALKQYTVTSSLGLQQQVLNLLSQLVQLRVNYCLLDSDQIFIGFVIKQFEFIEEGQIRNSESLIPHIFNFLVLLSYERYHSKSIISMPKIIQLCDGIMASGQHPTTHAIPALQPIVHDLFVLRAASKSESSKDLETQREVVVSMLLRLLQYHQVLEMFIIVLHQYHRESEDKWKRLSRQIVDLLLPMLAKQQVNLDCQVSVDVVHRLFEAVAPSVFRPVDFLLKTVFAAPDDLTWVGSLQRWISMVLIILRVIVAQSKEEVVLSRLHELGLGVLLFNDTIEKHRLKLPRDTDPLEVTAIGHQSETASSVPPQNIIARLLLQIVGVAAAEINTQSCSLHYTNKSALNFLCQELAHLLLYVTHMFQSGLYRHVAKSAMTMIQQPPETPSFFTVQQLNELFKQLAYCQPTLTLQWCNVLILLNYDNQSWWSEILQTPTKYIMSSPSRESCDVVSSPPVRLCCSADILRRGGLILFCDYVCENLNDAEHMTWVIINHVGDLIELSHEPPVQDFISAIHRNSAASGLFIQAINSRFENLNKVCSVKKTLHALEAIHMSQSGTLLTLLVDKFLHTNHLAVARLCDMIACRRVEMLLTENVQECSNQLPLEDLEKLLHFMKNNRLTKRHARLASLLTKLRNLMCSESKLTLSPERTHPLALTTSGINDIKVNKEWYISITREQCFNTGASPRECATMLAHMDYCAMLNIIMAQEFRFSILPECISLGTLRTLVKFREFAAKEANHQNDPSGVGHSPFKATSADPLLQAAHITLFRHINNIINMLPVPHQVINYKGKLNSNEEQYRTNMEELFMDPSWVDMVTHLLATLVQYFLSLPRLPWQPDVPDESLKDVARFSLLGLELVHWQFEQDQLPSSEHLSTVLQCFSLTLQKTKLSNVFSEQSQTTWVCSAIRSVHQILSSLMVLPGERLVKLIHQDSQDDMAASIVGSFDEFHHAVRACDQISELVHCLRTRLNPHDPHSCSLPGFLIGSLRNIIIGLARQPLVNSYARTPPLVWKLGWMPSPSGDMRTRLPPLPLDYLQEKDVLKEFIYRVNVLGWTSRQQFEETWMSLLGVLNPVSIGDEERHLSPEEELEQVQTSVLAMRGIISLLVQSTMTPKPGNLSNSTCDHRPRDKSLMFQHSRVGKKLTYVRGIVEREIHALTRLRHDKDGDQHYLSLKWETEERSLMFDHNAERQLGAYNFGLGQMCVESMWGLLGMLDMNQLLQEAADDSESTSGTDPSPGSPDQVYPSLQQIELSNMDRKERASAVSGLDIHSCLQFLLEQFGQFLMPNATPRVPLMQLNETIKSILYLSDLFTEQQQFQWMLDRFLEVQRNHPPEDELITQYTVVGVCKAAAIVGVDAPTAERLVKLVDSCLKSTHLPCKVCALFGSLYILEAGMSEITHQIIPLVIDCVLRQLTSITPATIVSDQFVMVMWSTSFFLIENYQEEIRETDFTAKVLQMAINSVSGENCFPLSIYSMLMRGLERLVLTGVLTHKDSESLVKLAVDRIQICNPQRSLAALGLMLTCMYAGKRGDEWSPSSVMDQPGGGTFFSDGGQDPESLIVAMERVTLLFERIRRGFPYEARVITRVLPTFLADFFPPQDIMNKVIGEFLSNQQPHPQLMARVVFQVFEKLLEKGQTDLVRDWVMLSLSNFTQRTPVSMAIWSLTCFFLSASTNSWLRALFPHVIGRMGSLDVVDQRLFCISALDFRSQLHMRPDEQRAFKAAFQAVAQPQSPYAELLALCS